MTIPEFIKKLRTIPAEIAFQETMDTIETHYNFSPISFINGNITNEAGQNSGSCKLFSFAKIQNLTKEETLNCFGEHYQHVIESPEGNDHQNIRTFMKSGWEKISFEERALAEK